jgi:Na+-transporting NADH:ubiquinone oxidoreductase subunit NqrB
LAAGFIVCYKVKRAETGFIFLAVLFLLEFTKRYIYLGWPIDLVLHRFSSGSLLVYALFMITDPMTTPNHRAARILWASVLAIITFILSTRFQIYEAPIWALLILSPFTALFDKIFVADKYQWKIENTKVSLYEK